MILASSPPHFYRKTNEASSDNLSGVSTFFSNIFFIHIYKRSCSAWLLASPMAAKIKRLCKGFKCISHIFVVNEREMEIGYPTDVKHVAHIGWDGSSDSAPSWMNEFKAGPGVSSPTSTWPFQDYDRSMGHRPGTEMFKDNPSRDLQTQSKNQNPKKKSSLNSSPKCDSSTPRSSRSARRYV